MDYHLPNKSKKPPKMTTMTMEAEERLAAADAGYTFAEYLALPGDDFWAENTDSKCKIIVMYRAKKHLEAIAWH